MNGKKKRERIKEKEQNERDIEKKRKGKKAPGRRRNNLSQTMDGD